MKLISRFSPTTQEEKWMFMRPQLVWKYFIQIESYKSKYKKLCCESNNALRIGEVKCKIFKLTSLKGNVRKCHIETHLWEYSEKKHPYFT